MSVEQVASVGFLPSTGLEAIESRAQATTQAATQADFSSWLGTEIQKVNDRVLAADKQIRDLALGKTQNLHEVMIALEEAKLSLSLMVQIRNRALEAYQDILRMQI
jgi:flagellar hook-basal body complex protein FliE